jgi:hypothetical protein
MPVPIFPSLGREIGSDGVRGCKGTVFPIHTVLPGVFQKPIGPSKNPRDAQRV